MSSISGNVICISYYGRYLFTNMADWKLVTCAVAPFAKDL